MKNHGVRLQTVWRRGRICTHVPMEFKCRRLVVTANSVSHGDLGAVRPSRGRDPKHQVRCRYRPGLGCLRDHHCRRHNDNRRKQTSVSYSLTFSYDVLSTPNLLSSSGPTSGRAHKATNQERFGLCICRLSLVIGKSSERPGAVQGARFVRGAANPGRRGPFWNLERKGKAAGVSGGVPTTEIGAAPRAHTTARVFLRATHPASPPPHFTPPPPARSSENPRTPSCSSRCDK